MRTSADNRQQRIQVIVAQISRLSEELSSLVLDGDIPLPPRPAVVEPVPVPPPAPARGTSRSTTSPLRFQAGDRVQILNNRNGLRGQLGTVTRTSVAFVYLSLDSTGREIFRSRLNVRKLE